MTGMDVLIVEDEGAHRKTLGRLLEPLKMNLSFLGNGKDAFLLLKKKDYTVAILDWVMPGMTGIELCSRIKSKSPATKVVMLTAKSSKKDREKALRAGADAYITKPYDPDELLASVQGLVDGVQTGRVNGTGCDESVRGRDVPYVFDKSVVCGMLHNIRTPLSILLNNSQLTELEMNKIKLSAFSGKKQLSEHLTRLETHQRRIQIAVTKAMDIIEGVLDVNCLNDGSKRIPLDLNRLIEQETEFLRADMCLKFNVTVTFDLDPHIPMIKAVASDFSQILQNMIQNACEAMDKSEIRQLTITTKFQRGQIFIALKDTGPGIEASILPQLFIPNQSTKEKSQYPGSGFGLGLYISKRILDSYHGEIGVEKTGPGGSVIVIEIPSSTGCGDNGTSI